MCKDSSYSSSWVSDKHCSLARSLVTLCSQKRSSCNRLSKWASICSRYKISLSRKDFVSWTWTLSWRLSKLQTLYQFWKCSNRVLEWCSRPCKCHHKWSNSRCTKSSHRCHPNSSFTNHNSQATDISSHLQLTNCILKICWYKRLVPKCRDKYSKTLKTWATSILTQTCRDNSDLMIEMMLVNQINTDSATLLTHTRALSRALLPF